MNSIIIPDGTAHPMTFNLLQDSNGNYFIVLPISIPQPSATPPPLTPSLDLSKPPDSQYIGVGFP